ncbi:MAG TPA: 3-oxoacyl-[acyl-carrier-protein] synthase III C-terminal domain-containing protein [Afifellaceae bacterium]|nr:3-oxoacyl-[acyl-carrier-protein] synthase III C-terminal domain-containing protein [Afifellaceae bacterium]
MPQHRFSQAEVRDYASCTLGRRMSEFDRLAKVYDNAGVEERRSCVPLNWYGETRGWVEKNNLYLENAVALLQEAASACVERAAIAPSEVDWLVVVSTTGIATPDLGARLMQIMPLRTDVKRLPLFGLGCAGGVLGLSRAADLARLAPGDNVLLLVVELCGLTFRYDDLSKNNVVATALFSDGAAAALLRAGDGAGPAILACGEHTWPDSLDVMGWSVEDDGLGVIFSRSIPHIVVTELRPVADRFLAAHGLDVADIDGLICHPGGAKVLDALEEAFAPASDGVEDARQIMRERGNMSAATVLFVLERRLASGAKGRHLMTALGPGFTAALALLDL